ncbi:hypothetical protein DERF_002027 [Dermatophagoides farinae]|uniref:Uncharacterized protein n=1 Tax=Dermatophagoides farinae TaxID=6954 RepID=A0A922LA81_DERFA|nr:hypothetical protein DERF_002027 [Dermatophagoides farinae]
MDTSLPLLLPMSFAFKLKDGKTLIRLETRTKLTTKCDKSYFDFDDEENANKNRDRNVYYGEEERKKNPRDLDIYFERYGI